MPEELIVLMKKFEIQGAGEAMLEEGSTLNDYCLEPERLAAMAVGDVVYLMCEVKRGVKGLRRIKRVS